ncbi:MAG: hypothetical protein ACREFD_17360 [Stellaceae bacterium]
MRYEWVKLGIVAILCLGIAACSGVQSAANNAAAVASAAQTICKNLVPAAEKTANAIAKGNTLTKVQDTETNYIDPACATVINLTSAGAAATSGTAPAAQSQSK